MAIYELRKQTDIEKRLKLLRQQVYGKENVSNITSTGSTTLTTSTLSAGKYQVSREEKQESADSTYLYHDLTKIGILASLALGVQFVLLTLNFF